jgi:hypothetical protein
MKRLLIFLAVAALCAAPAVGQQVEFEQSQARLIEPKQDVFIVPLVADIEIMENQVRQEYYSEFPISSVGSLTFEDLDNYKARALHKAAHQSNADLIVAATFNVKADEKKKLLIVEIAGYPGKYINFRPLNLDADYDWIPNIYPPTNRTVENAEKTKAVKAK